MDWGAVIQGGGQLLGSIVNQIGAKRRAERELNQNKELADYQYNQDVKMWEAQNAYNDPSQQMIRLKNAGLNPNLVYGSGSVAGNTTGNLPKYNAPKADYQRIPGIELPNMGAILNQFADIRMKDAQIDSVRQEMTLRDKEIGIKQLDYDLKDYALQAVKADYPIQRELTRFSKEAAEQNINLNLARYNLEADKWKTEKPNREQLLDNLKAEELLKGGTLSLQGIEKKLKEAGLTGTDLENRLKQMEINIRTYKEAMARKGVNPDSNVYWQGIQNILKEGGIDLTSDNPIQDYFKEAVRRWENSFRYMFGDGGYREKD